MNYIVRNITIFYFKCTFLSHIPSLALYLSSFEYHNYIYNWHLPIIFRIRGFMQQDMTFVF